MQLRTMFAVGLLAAIAPFSVAGTYSISQVTVTHSGGWPDTWQIINSRNKYHEWGSGGQVSGTYDAFVAAQQSLARIQTFSVNNSFTLYRSNVTVTFKLRYEKANAMEAAPGTQSVEFHRRFQLMVGTATADSGSTWNLSSSTNEEIATSPFYQYHDVSHSGSLSFGDQYYFPSISDPWYEVTVKPTTSVTFVQDLVNPLVYWADATVPVPSSPIENHSLQLIATGSSTSSVGVGTSCRWEYRVTKIGSVTIQSDF